MKAFSKIIDACTVINSYNLNNGPTLVGPMYNHVSLMGLGSIKRTSARLCPYIPIGLTGSPKPEASADAHLTSKSIQSLWPESVGETGDTFLEFGNPPHPPPRNPAWQGLYDSGGSVEQGIWPTFLGSKGAQLWTVATARVRPGFGFTACSPGGVFPQPNPRRPGSIQCPRVTVMT